MKIMREDVSELFSKQKEFFKDSIIKLIQNNKTGTYRIPQDFINNGGFEVECDTMLLSIKTQIETILIKGKEGSLVFI